MSPWKQVVQHQIANSQLEAASDSEVKDLVVKDHFCSALDTKAKSNWQNPLDLYLS